MTSQRLSEMAYAYKQAGVLLAALDLDLFTKIERGSDTVDALAEVLEVDPGRVDALVVSLLALQLVERDGGHLRNAADVQRYFVRDSKAYFGDGLLHTARNGYASFGDLARHFRPRLSRYAAVARDPRAAREMTVAGFNYSLGSARRLARQYDFSRHSLLMDVGGGSGVYSITACQAFPSLRAVVFDFPVICAVTEEFIEQAGLRDRVRTVTGNFLSDPLPVGADTALLSGNLQAYGSGDAAQVIRRIFEALEPGGTLNVIDYMLDAGRDGPLEPAFMNLSSALAEVEGDRGRVHSGAEVAGYMQAAGFVDTQVFEFQAGILGRVCGRKPGR
jgi:hypothetical protein